MPPPCSSISRSLTSPLFLRCELQVFVYREALVLIAMHPFDLATPDDPFSHLTNTCVSMEHEDFKAIAFFAPPRVCFAVYLDSRLLSFRNPLV